MDLFKNMKFTSFQVIIYGFALLILVGTLLLMLPIATIDGSSTSFLESLFTATSATCVTGLIVHDTATYWSLFGQIVILILIQIGGLGIVMVASLLTVLSGKKIGLMQRSTLASSISAPHLGGIIKLAKFIFRTTFFVEMTGAVILSTVFVPRFGLVKGVWYGIFHSISAFCNAGFDLMGVITPYSSLCEFAQDPVVSITIMVLIVVGGLSFMTWNDIQEHHFHIKKYSMQSKIILTTTFILITLPTLYFFFVDYANEPLLTRFLLSFFQAISPRTAGFNTADLTKMTDTGKFIQIALMLVGGAPGSTAGGMKVTTFFIVMISALSIFEHSDKTECFGRSIYEQAVRNANTIFMMYVVICLIGGCLISSIDGLPIMECFFEAASAIGTVGLTQGITTSLSVVSRIIIIFLMYIGRVGGLTLIYAVFPRAHERKGRFVKESVMIG